MVCHCNNYFTVHKKMKRETRNEQTRQRTENRRRAELPSTTSTNTMVFQQLSESEMEKEEQGGVGLIDPVCAINAAKMRISVTLDKH